MQCTTRSPLGDDGQAYILDLAALLRQLAALPDARCPKGVRYALAPVLLLIILAKLAGEDRPSGIADWIAHRHQFLRRALRLPWSRMPQHNTYRRILAEGVAPDDLERVVSTYLRGLPGVGHSIVLAIDGKTVRGTIDVRRPQGEHLLAAYLPEEGIVLVQVAASGEASELGAALQVVQTLDLRGKVVTGDALYTQRALSAHIVTGGGDYVWIVKDNQPQLRADIEQVFTVGTTTVMGGDVGAPIQQYEQVEKGHGRQERRTIRVSSALQGYSDWPGLAQVFQLERWRKDSQSGQEEQETVYGVTSLGATEATAKEVLCYTRAHWGIENGLHRRRDVTFGEDGTRLTCGRAGRVMATLNNLVIGLLRHRGETNIAAARRRWDAVITLALTSPSASLVT